MFPPPLPAGRSSNFRAGWALRGSRIIEAAAPLAENDGLDQRRTPCELSEAALLIALNEADVAALSELKPISKKLAEKIVWHRQRNDSYPDLEELLEVPGIRNFRFEKIVGRAPLAPDLRLHRLMRIPLGENITIANLRPWRNPAAGIELIYLLPRSSALKVKNSASRNRKVTTVSVGSWELVFIGTYENFTNRTGYILRFLPTLLRSINHERSFT